MGWRRYRKRLRRAGHRLRKQLLSATAREREAAGYWLAALVQRWSPAAREHLDLVGRARLKRELEWLRRFRAERPEIALSITCAGRLDGAGGQALSVMSALAFAHNRQCRYLHTPLRTVDHLQGDAEAWRRRWETFFNLGHGEAPVPPDAEVMLLPEFQRMIGCNPGWTPSARLVIESRHFAYAEMARPESIEELRARLRAKYFASDKSAIRVHRRDGALGVAVHLRRGDVAPGHRRFLPDAVGLATIGALRATIESLGHAAIFNLFSEGEPDQFAPYAAAGCVLHLGPDPFEAFHNLVVADILVTANSQFSRAAAMLSDGIAINPTGTWGPGRKWLKRAPDGSFDTAALAALLGAAPARKPALSA